VPYQRVNGQVNSKRGVTPSAALRMAKIFGTSSEFWLNLQMRWDVTFAQQASTAFASTINGASASNGMMAKHVTWRLLTTIEGKP
jgi:antitoxin HigA-1